MQFCIKGIKSQLLRGMIKIFFIKIRKTMFLHNGKILYFLQGVGSFFSLDPCCVSILHLYDIFLFQKEFKDLGSLLLVSKKKLEEMEHAKIITISDTKVSKLIWSCVFKCYFYKYVKRSNQESLSLLKLDTLSAGKCKRKILARAEPIIWCPYLMFLILLRKCCLVHFT